MDHSYIFFLAYIVANCLFSLSTMWLLFVFLPCMQSGQFCVGKRTKPFSPQSHIIVCHCPICVWSKILRRKRVMPKIPLCILGSSVLIFIGDIFRGIFGSYLFCRSKLKCNFSKTSNETSIRNKTSGIYLSCAKCDPIHVNHCIIYYINQLCV